MPPSKIDALSFKLGQIENSIEELQRRANEDRELQTNRHEQNQEGLAQIRQDTQRSISEYSKTIGDALGQITSDLREHAAAVANMRTSGQIDSISRSKLALLASVGLIAIWVVGRAIEAGISAAISYFLKMKLGG